MNTALQQESPELASQLKDLSDGSLSHVALAVAKRAIEINKIEDPFISQILESPSFGDADVRGKLDALAAKIEDPYLDAMGEDIDLETRPDLLILFQKARAVTSLYFALSENPTVDAANSIYEALHAEVAPDDIKNILESISEV